MKTITLRNEFVRLKSKTKSMYISKLEDLIYNEIFIECVTSSKPYNTAYTLQKKDGEIEFDKYKLVDKYEVIDKTNYHRLKSVNYGEIVETFKGIGIDLGIIFLDNKVIVRFSITEEEYLNHLYSNKGIVDINIEIWKLFKKVNTYNTFVCLYMYSKKGNSSINFVKQIEEFTGVEDKNISRVLKDTINYCKKIGIEVTLELKGNKYKDKYKDAKVIIDMSNIRIVEIEDTKEVKEETIELDMEETIELAKRYQIYRKIGGCWYLSNGTRLFGKDEEFLFMGEIEGLKELLTKNTEMYEELKEYILENRKEFEKKLKEYENKGWLTEECYSENTKEDNSKDLYKEEINWDDIYY